MKRELSNIVFFEGLPPKQELETWYIKEPGHKMLIIDDLMTEASTSKDVVNIYIVNTPIISISFAFSFPKMHSVRVKSSALSV